MKIEVIREHRKTMVLKIVSSEKAILKAPIGLSEKKVQEFLISKQRWLDSHSEKIALNEEFSLNFDFEKYIYINGTRFADANEVVLDFDKLSAQCKKRELKKYYLSMFGKLEELAYKKSQETGLTFKEIKDVDSVRIWGSYNTKSQMKLNYKLLVLPEKLVDYVICHELCHSIHMNHKPQFWNDLEKICPDCKKLRKEISKYSFVLKYNF